MNPFPKEWELLSLFEVEPVLTDPDVPWFYNELTFENDFGPDRIRCIIAPAYCTLQFSWWHHGIECLSLDLHWISGLSVSTESGHEGMTVSFYDKFLIPLEIKLRPAIACRWGTTSVMP